MATLASRYGSGGAPKQTFGNKNNSNVTLVSPSGGGYDALYKVINPDGTTTYTSNITRYNEVHYGSGGGYKPTPYPTTEQQQRAEEEQKKKEQEGQRQAELDRKKQQEQSNLRSQELQNRISSARNKLINSGAKENTRIYSDTKTGQRSEISRISRLGTKVETIRNLETGEVRTTLYDVGRGGGSSRSQGSVTEKKEYTDKLGQGMSIAPELQNKKLVGDNIYFGNVDNRQSRVEIVKPTKKPSVAGKVISYVFPPASIFLNKEKQRRISVAVQTEGKKSLFFGKAGQELVGVNIPGQDVTLKDVQKKMRDVKGTAGFPVRVASYLVPTTPLDIAVTGVGSGIYFKGGTIIRAGIGGYTAYSGGKTAFDSSLTAEERTAGGLIGGFGGLGVIKETSPFIKGGVSRLSPRYKPITKTPTGDVIKNLPRADKTGTFDLALIKTSNKATGNKPAFESSAYGFSREYQKAYAGTSGDVTTSARSLISWVNRIGIKKEVVSRERGKGFTGEIEQFGLFATPYDLQTKTTQTRFSRLGIKNIKDLFINSNKDSGVSFKLGTENPQFVVFEDAPITTTGGKGSFKIGGKLSSELEVTALPGSEISNVKKIGVTTITGQAIDIFSAKLKSSINEKSLTVTDFKRAGLDVSSKPVSSSVSGYGILSLVSASSEPIKKTSVSSVINTKSNSISPINTNTAISNNSPSRKKTSSKPTIKAISPPSISGTSPISSSKSILKITSKLSNIKRPTTPVNPISYQRKEKRKRSGDSTILISQFSKILKGKKTSSEDSGFYKIKSKRFGREINIGTSKTQKMAEDILSKYLSGTLAASGYISKSTGEKVRVKDLDLFKSPEFTKSKRNDFTLVQKNPFRLRSGDSQTRELNFFKKRSGNKKKKRSAFD